MRRDRQPVSTEPILRRSLQCLPRIFQRVSNHADRATDLCHDNQQHVSNCSSCTKVSEPGFVHRVDRPFIIDCIPRRLLRHKIICLELGSM